ncbi:MAG: GNAT family N-acetyltransferase [Carnobacterium sp.]|uniref:GNAT family N-acetyltransferase n=1 Tax=Carnobacterium sp. TaxID=48221 RepID=UPI003314744B
MKIREAKIEDAVELLEVIKNVEESGNMLFEPGERTISIEGVKQMIGRLNESPKGALLVAIENQYLLGYMVVKVDHPKRVSHRAYVAVGVHSEFRGRGVGTELFYKLFELAEQQQIHRLELTVLTTNEAALNLYKKMGFKIEGLKKDSLCINEEYEDEFSLSKLIG